MQTNRWNWWWLTCKKTSYRWLLFSVDHISIVFSQAQAVDGQWSIGVQCVQIYFPFDTFICPFDLISVSSLYNLLFLFLKMTSSDAEILPHWYWSHNGHTEFDLCLSPYLWPYLGGKWRLTMLCTTFYKHKVESSLTFTWWHLLASSCYKCVLF